MDHFNKEGRIKFRGSFSKGGRGSFAAKHFTNGYESLIRMPKKL
jgi:hypothetical protein